MKNKHETLTEDFKKLMIQYSAEALAVKIATFAKLKTVKPYQPPHLNFS